MSDTTRLSKPLLARDVMVRKLITLKPGDDVAEGVDVLLRNNISGAPVVDDEGRYLGVFSEKCCMRVLMETVRHVEEVHRRPSRAREFMITRPVRLGPDDYCCEAVKTLLQYRISGAPVTEPDGTFLGTFSEKTSMSLLVQSTYEQLPTSRVRLFMDEDRGRVIDPDVDLHRIAQMFIDTPYRRLVILENGRLAGLISRRDVLRNSRIFTSLVQHLVTARREPELAREPGTESGIYLAAHDHLATPTVEHFMDDDARTIPADLDLLSIAQIFLTTPYRRLPVVEDGKVLGQVSRRDVLAAFYDLTEPHHVHTAGTLYLSADDGRTAEIVPGL